MPIRYPRPEPGEQLAGSICPAWGHPRRARVGVDLLTLAVSAVNARRLRSRLDGFVPRGLSLRFGFMATLQVFCAPLLPACPGRRRSSLMINLLTTDLGSDPKDDCDEIEKEGDGIIISR